jgi:hypothetical protein
MSLVLPQSHRCWRTGSKENIRRHAYELFREGVHALGIAGGVAMFDLDIASLGPSPRGEFLHKLRDAGPVLRIVLGIAREHANASHPLGMLRPRRQRPHRRRAAEQGDELAAVHSITSSARASSVGGNSIPSAFAVVRLTTRSYLVDCSNGRSPGFAPRRILST